MQVPLEIAFHNVEPAPGLEDDIRKRAGKLNAIYERLTACKVRVELPHRQHETGNVPEVHIEMSVPGKELVVTRSPHKAKQKFAEPSVGAAIRDAFRAAERQLKDYKEQLGGETKRHDPSPRDEIAQLNTPAAPKV